MGEADLQDQSVRCGLCAVADTMDLEPLLEAPDSRQLPCSQRASGQAMQRLMLLLFTWPVYPQGAVLANRIICLGNGSLELASRPRRGNVAASISMRHIPGIGWAALPMRDIASPSSTRRDR